MMCQSVCKSDFYSNIKEAVTVYYMSMKSCPFFIANHYVKMNNTSWTYSTRIFVQHDIQTSHLKGAVR